MNHHCKPTYTGHWAHHAHDCHPPAAHQQHGFCHSCCQPASSCCCHHKECRKESKDLLILPYSAERAKSQEFDLKAPVNAHATIMMLLMAARDKDLDQERMLAAGAVGAERTFIGGGCCVHLSIEYMPRDREVTFSGVVVVVKDSKGTLLSWAKSIDEAHTEYQIEEDIITTHPGAELSVFVVNAVARIRWCEVFSETCC